MRMNFSLGLESRVLTLMLYFVNRHRIMVMHKYNVLYIPKLHFPGHFNFIVDVESKDLIKSISGSEMHHLLVLTEVDSFSVFMGPRLENDIFLCCVFLGIYAFLHLHVFQYT